MGITKKQKDVYDFICDFLRTQGFSPSQNEIKERFGFKSLGSVQRYISYLTDAGYLRNTWNSKRGLEPNFEAGPSTSLGFLEIPLMGTVAAGLPLERVFSNETINVPTSMVKGNNIFALRVAGESMIDDGILDGDVILVREQKTANNGDTVVALVDNEATVKRFYKKSNSIELHPANSSMEPFVYTKGNVDISGIVVGLLRTY